MRSNGARAQVYHDNLEGHRHEGHSPPVVTSEARRIASKLLDDPIYLTRLRTRLRKGTAGAIEIWLWRWKLGDPMRAEQATDETDRKRFEALRGEVRQLIMNRPQEYQALEDAVLGELPVGLLPAGDPEPAEATDGDDDE